MVHGWMRRLSKRLVSRKRKKGEASITLFYGTWVANFMLRQDVGRFMLGKYLSDKKIPWQRRRRLGMALPKIRQQPVF